VVVNVDVDVDSSSSVLVAADEVVVDEVVAVAPG